MALDVPGSFEIAAPRLREATSAPLSAECVIAFATDEKNMLPALLATLSGMIEQPPAIPAVPRKLLSMAAATPAQAVPCPAAAELSSGLESLSP